MDFEFDEYDINSRIDRLFRIQRPKSIKDLDVLFKKITYKYKIVNKEIKQLIKLMKPCGLHCDTINYDMVQFAYINNKIDVIVEEENVFSMHDSSFGFSSHVKTCEQTKNILIAYMVLLQIFDKMPKKFNIKQTVNNIKIEQDKIEIDYCHDGRNTETKMFNLCDPDIESNIKAWLESIYNKDLFIVRLQKVSEQLKKHKTNNKVKKLINRLDKLVGK